MQNDLGKTFGEIHGNAIAAFYKQLLEVQYYRSDRTESLEWVGNLRFLDISDVPELEEECKTRSICSTTYDAQGIALVRSGDKPELSIPVVLEEDDPEDDPPKYLAVSWKWTSDNESVPLGCGWGESFDYRIERPEGTSYKSGFPDRYMERVIRLAQSHNITKLWIDKDSILQRPGDGYKDKELGIQAMDLVYEDAALAVGLLTTPLMHQDEVDTLGTLLNNDIFSDLSQHSKFRTGTDTSKLQTLILKILSDPRWSRGWIFQEDHLASYRMRLLVPCSEHIDRNRKYDFGDAPGELQVNLAEFRGAVTTFCLAHPGDNTSWPLSEMLQKAKRYKTWNAQYHIRKPITQRCRSVPISEHLLYDEESVNGNTLQNHTAITSYPTTTLGVLDDICYRSLTEEQDRIAILANALRFMTRLDIRPASPIIQPGRYSLSTTLLALILLNGEILLNSHTMPESILSHTLQSYIKACELKITAPIRREEQYFIDHCRYKSPIITTHGIQTQGFLFKLACRTPNISRCSRMDAIVLSHYERNNLPKSQASKVRRRNQRLNALEREVLKTVIEKLEKRWPECSLAEHLESFLDLDYRSRPRHELLPSQISVFKRISAVVTALLAGREVRLARLAEKPASSEPSAILIAPEPGGWKATKPHRNRNVDVDKHTRDESVNIFISWDDKWTERRQERLAMLQVTASGQNVTRRHADANINAHSLHVYGWVNGLFDIRGANMSMFVFPLAGIPHMDKSEKRETERS